MTLSADPREYLGFLRDTSTAGGNLHTHGNLVATGMPDAYWKGTDLCEGM